MTVFALIVSLLYVVSFVNYWVYFQKKPNLARRMATPLLGLAAAAHGGYCVVRAVSFGYHPMADLFEILSVISLALTLVYLLMELWTRNKSTGVFIVPIALTMLLISFFGSNPTGEIAPVLRGKVFGMHTGFAMLAYCAFFLSAVYGVMHCLFHRALRRKQFGLIFERLPSLNSLARMTSGSALVGLGFLSISMALGIWWMNDKYPGQWTDPKFVLTVAVWALYGLTLGYRYIFRCNGRRVVVMTLAAFFLMIAAVILVSFLPTFHDFGA